MPKDLKDLPRPPSDNGRGLHGNATTGWSGGNKGYDYWINELVAMGIKWFKVLDDGGDSLNLCERLLAAGIFPIVRIIRKDPAPNDTTEPNPGHLGDGEEKTIQRLVAAGVRYFETNNEPNLSAEWKHNAMPSDPLETAKLVALNWLFDARLILSAGGYPGLPAISAGSNMDLIGALVALGRQDILLEGSWVALHNYCLNHPLDYPDDPINRIGQVLTTEQYAQGVYSEWAWWDKEKGRAETLEEINTLRAQRMNPAHTIQQDHACFREFEYYNALAIKYLGRSIPIISTEGGYLVGRREDLRYARVTPEAHRDQTVAMFDFMQRQAPDYYFAAVPWLLVESAGWETDAWASSFWQRAHRDGSDGRNGIPTMTVRGAVQGDRLAVIDAVKAMPNLARRLPGIQPAPPIQPPLAAAPAKPASAQTRYVVAVGDTPSKIATQFGTTWQAIAALNQIATPDLIHPGQTLLIPKTADSAKSAATAPETLTAHPKASAQPDWPSWLREAATSPAARVTPPTQPPPPPVETLQPPEVQPKSRHFSPPSPTPPPPAETLKPPEAHPKPRPLSPPSPMQPPPPAETLKPTGARPISLAGAPARTPTGLPVPRAKPSQLEWDWRLDALNVSIEPAEVKPGARYWRLVRAVYQGPEEAGGTHHVYYNVLDEQGQPLNSQKVWQGWPGDRTDATTNAQGRTNVPLWVSYAPEQGERGPYSAWVDGLPCDCVRGIGLPLKRHVNFLLTWQLAIG